VCVYAKDGGFLTRNSKGHVARGAVLVRACAPFIVRRPILRSKAVTTFVKITDKIRNSPVYEDLYTQKDSYKGDEWYFAAQWLAKQVASRFPDSMPYIQTNIGYRELKPRSKRPTIYTKLLLRPPFKTRGSATSTRTRKISLSVRLYSLSTTCLLPKKYLYFN
jgi:hypothetical protein